MKAKKYKLTITTLIIGAITLAITQSAWAAWLSGWDKRVKLTIDEGDIDSDLSDFPILVYLSTSSGRNSDDVSCVFDEVGANSKKIAVTKSDGTTECYVEIEKWDNASEKAWLWVKVSGTNSISATTDTDLYLYYDNDHADNTTYVGDTNSTPAQNVWDGNFLAVWHLPDGTTLSAIDSTSNSKDGVITGSAAISEKIDGGWSGDGTTDYIDITMTLPSTVTISAWGNWDAGASTDMLWCIDSDNKGPDLFFYNSYICLNTWDSGGNPFCAEPAGVHGNWHLYTTVIQSGTGNTKLYFDSSEAGTATYKDPAGSDFHISSSAGYDWQGDIDEVRISDIVHPPAWIKASYESERDNLLDFGSEETQGGGTADTIQMKGGVTLKSNVTIKTQ